MSADDAPPVAEPEVARLLEPLPAGPRHSPKRVRRLLFRSVLAEFGGRIRAASDDADELGDQDTADICTEISRGVDKWLWFVEAHVQQRRS